MNVYENTEVRLCEFREHNSLTYSDIIKYKTVKVIELNPNERITINRSNGAIHHFIFFDADNEQIVSEKVYDPSVMTNLAIINQFK